MELGLSSLSTCFVINYHKALHYKCLSIHNAPLTFHNIQLMSLNPQQRIDATYLKFIPLLNNMPFYHNHKIIIKLSLF